MHRYLLTQLELNDEAASAPSVAPGRRGSTQLGALSAMRRPTINFALPTLGPGGGVAGQSGGASGAGSAADQEEAPRICRSRAAAASGGGRVIARRVDVVVVCAERRRQAWLAPTATLGAGAAAAAGCAA